ncbi:hypothetical protein T07_7244 [Trichinella nelsoni]|uniref:Uncharacterized protein n=1 Tax=Trichinella nelsoni TaxID=6336 RepID=A0A0V0S1S7_9BILA|nr:hypothetical protein T07_7244 [Trichinella nelsoni]
MYIPKRQSFIGHSPPIKGNRSACFEQCNARVNFWYMAESGGTQLTHFPMYRLSEVELASLYPRIWKVALNGRKVIRLFLTS